MKPTLGLTGLTMNAMALIAPGAFLWLTFFIRLVRRICGSRTVSIECRRVPGLSDKPFVFSGFQTLVTL